MEKAVVFHGFYPGSLDEAPGVRAWGKVQRWWRQQCRSCGRGAASSHLNIQTGNIGYNQRFGAGAGIFFAVSDTQHRIGFHNPVTVTAPVTPTLKGGRPKHHPLLRGLDPERVRHDRVPTGRHSRRTHPEGSRLNDTGDINLNVVRLASNSTRGHINRHGVPTADACSNRPARCGPGKRRRKTIRTGGESVRFRDS